MSLRPHPGSHVPDETARVAQAAFPRGNSYLTLRDELETMYADSYFADLFPTRGQAVESPGHLALVAVLPFAENLSDRQAADAVRSRIDWKYLLGLDLGDPGFDFLVLSEFRARLLAGGLAQRLLDDLLERFRERGVLKERGKPRTDSTHIQEQHVTSTVWSVEAKRYAIPCIVWRQSSPNGCKLVCPRNGMNGMDRVVNSIASPRRKAHGRA